MKILVLLPVLVLPMAACAAPVRQVELTPDPAAGTTVDVRNDSPSDVTIYLIRGAVPVRLGTVAAQSAAQLRLPRAYLGFSELALEARAFALDESFRSAPIPFSPGHRLTLRLTSPLPTASYATYLPLR